MQSTKEFRLFRRDNGIYYFRLPGWKSWKSTGETNERTAIRYISTVIEGDLTKQEKVVTFELYSKGFFTPGASDWIRKEIGLGRRITSCTCKLRDGILRTHLIPKFGKYPLRDITPGMIEDWLISVDRASQTKSHILSVLKIVLDKALRDGLIQSNPAAICTRPRVQNRCRDILTPEEVYRLFPDRWEDFARVWPNVHYGVMCEIMVSGGLRTGEARALTRSAIDFERKGILVVAAVNRDGKIGLPKAGEVRVVPLPEKTLSRIRFYLKRIPADAEYIFSGRTSGPIDRMAPLKYLKEALDNAGICTRSRWITPHALRHTYNTMMRDILRQTALEGLWDEDRACLAGVKTADTLLRQLTGHRSEAMTNLYDHPDLLKNLEVMSRMFREQFDRFWCAS